MYGWFFLYTEVGVLFGPGGMKSDQEGNRAIVLGIFCGKLEMRVNGIDVLGELSGMFSLLGDKGVIHISKPKPGWIGGIF